MHRRTLLAAIGSGAVAIQAGCLTQGLGGPDEGDGNGGNGDGTNDDGSDGGDSGNGNGDTPERDVQPAVSDHFIETVGTDCMSGENGAGVDVEFGTEGVTLDGVAEAPTPCYEAVIGSAAVDAGELRVDVALEDTDEMCTECIGAISYTATVHLDDADGLDTVTVEHGGEGRTFTVKRDGGD